MTPKQIHEIFEALVQAESAMFHVLADNGFNTREDIEAMVNALLGIRRVILVVKEGQEKQEDTCK